MTYFTQDQTESGVATVTLTRADKHNAFDDQMIADLTRAFQSLGADPAVRVIILKAEGKSFSAGADLGWMRRMASYDYEANLQDAQALATLMATIDQCPKPTIAQVEGAAFGGGVGLAACCDIAVGTANALFCLSETRLGLIPAVIAPYVVAALGQRAARRYMISAERFDAQTAHRLGLLHEVFATDDIEGRVKTLAEKLCTNSPQAMMACKELIGAVAHQDPTDIQVQQDTAQRIATQRASQDGKEGVMAFLEKRLPRWHPDSPDKG